MLSNKTKVKSNLIYGFAGQIVILMITIVLPRFIIVSFGSDMNGLVSAISQIFTYLALLEAGIGNASLNLLYKNIAQNDGDGICSTLDATQTFFMKLMPLYIAAVGIFVFVYPFIVKTDVSSSVIRMIILIQGISNIIGFYSTNTLTQLFMADGRSYVVSNLDLMQKIFTTVLQLVLIISGFDIVAVQIMHLGITVLRTIAVNLYAKRTYPWFKYSCKGDVSILEQRGAFAIHEFSNVIFQSTDVFILSAFCSTMIASVYSIYNLIFISLNSFLALFNRGFDFVLGQVFHSDRKKYVTIHDAYEAFYMALVFAVMTVACVMAIPFVSLYTDGVSDVNYIDKWLPLLFSLIQVLSCSRAVSSKLISISNHAKETIPNTIAEALINLLVSLVLVQFMGIYGVLLGTIIALLYRTNDIIVYANIKILKRKPINTYKNMVLYMALFFGFVYLFREIEFMCATYVQLILSAIWIASIIFVTYGIVALIFNHNIVILLQTFFKKNETKDEVKNESQKYL